MEYIPSFRDDLHADIQPSFMHSFRDEHNAKMMYGLPKVKKFPMPDAKHVRSAIRFFNYAKPSQERELANAILARMDDYGIDPDDINIGDDNRFKKYLQHSHLAHHGIKGMHWGVRRYQNPDGSLTDAGRKRYLNSDGSLTDAGRKKYQNPDGSLTDAGRKLYQNPDGNLTDTGRKLYYGNDATLSRKGVDFNKKARTDFRSYRNATLHNIRATNPDFVKAEKRYRELQKINSEGYKKDFNAFLKNKDFIGSDYEDFRDKTYDRWRKSDLGKEQETVEKDLRRMLDDAAKEHPLYNKNFRQLRYFNPNVYSDIRNIPYSKAIDDFETMNYGRQVVNEIMVAIRSGETEITWD